MRVDKDDPPVKLTDQARDLEISARTILDQIISDRSVRFMPILSLVTDQLATHNILYVLEMLRRAAYETERRKYVIYKGEGRDDIHRIAKRMDQFSVVERQLAKFWKIYNEKLAENDRAAAIKMASDILSLRTKETYLYA